MKNYSLYLISNKPEQHARLQSELGSETLDFFDGSGYKSFAKLINDCTVFSSTETVILMSYKVTPNLSHITKTLELLDQGFAFAALYRFGFFGFKKQLFREIGMMDERYIGGGFEDNDLYIRLKESNLAGYITTEMPFMTISSTWGDYTPAFQHFKNKWGVTHSGASIVKRLLPEDKYDYNLGKPITCDWLSSDKSIITGYNPNKYTLE